jgi:undecaprenyl-diphosphatase
MAEVANDSVNPDISMLRDINDIARHAPGGVNRAVEFAGEYGLLALLALLAGWCWWRTARRSAEPAAAVAGVAWAALAAVTALLLDFPVRSLVERPRPYEEHDGLDVLVHGSHGYSFASDRVAVAAALTVGLFLVSRVYGAVAFLLTVAEGFTQVYLGVHYPTDVVGGFALGAATALLLAPLALALLTAAARTLAATRAAVLIHPHRPSRLQASPPCPAASRDRPAASRHSAADKDLAA